MPATYSARSALVLLALALVAAGCGDDDGPARTADGALAVYSSVPRQGVLAREGAAVAAGQRLALEDAGQRAGGRRIRLVELDSAEDADEPWDPAAIESNANRAGDDPAAVAYLGELGLGGSAVSVPVTNAAGLAQVSPGDPLPSLTQPDPGGGGEIPARYYPDGERSFLRLVPHGGVEAKVLVDWAREQGAGTLAIVRDQRVLGQELASWALYEAQRAKLPVEVERARAGADDYEDLAEDVAERRPKVVILTMPAGEDADSVVAELRETLPAVPILATSAVAADPPPGVDFIDPHLPPQEYGPATARVLKRLGRSSGDPFAVAALYGYESMRLVLGAIGRARPRGDADRAAVLRELLGVRRAEGIFGTYSLVPGGDVATAAFASYRASAGARRPLRLRSAEGGPAAP
ncbi:MAG TPA: ABC transporter substrate-binding protein [Thermoleophilaceae bacterium]|jgi:branched-chain amino acid transport system substrate-binding protein